MTHLDRDTLALVALAELDLTPAEREHLAACPGCVGELDALRRTVLIGRSAGSVELVEPADAVWGRIHSALGFSAAVAAPPRLAEVDLAAAGLAGGDLAGGDLTKHTTPGVGPAAGAASGTERPGAEPAGEQAPVVQLDQHRRRRVWLPVAAAACAVGIVGGIVGGVWWQSTREPAAETVLAQAQLDALPGWTASGSASVEESADGRREVVVDLADDTGNEGLREVWLLTADATGLVSVGLLDGATGRFSLPADLDLAEFPVVDVSAEPADGNPAHSGDSIVRGTLTGL
ncbi:MULTISPECIES: anti-sigma factor domain-containing protein [unclassified Cryobacterium]|uniref:anti-sigma factor domain-containing protein n=1 Tax=unclassified Cryobacterium TaxID=2649013 RepID=UPI00106D4F68|nr:MULTISPECIES: anti-sigma factor [unclassified Cryobacterium]TFC59482.1 anti-sigma factor [Cryobacterium sp. TMB3-1-2]TFC67278.1 anti-sigma factor [Cryobacterium sp. TMB3-15]TFC73209.1 anti-sigma factor [Cryobacterium sp. TMB3-10]TFD46097.1 anti-sigma factor [Cryobacterium sp. TMB3-12]